MIWRRKRSVVKRQEQVWFALEVLVNSIAMSLVICFLLFVPPMNQLMGHEALSNLVWHNLAQLAALKWPLLLIAFAITILIGLIQSHRLFGAVYALEKTLQAWQQGEQRVRVKLRKFDYLTSLQQAINNLLDQQTMKSAELQQDLEAINTLAKAGQLDQTQAMVAKLLTRLKCGDTSES